MAFRSNNPYQPEFRTVKKLRGKTIDPTAISMKVPSSPDVYDSIYVKDFIKARERNSNQMGLSADRSQERSPVKIGKPKAFAIKRRGKEPERSQ